MKATAVFPALVLLIACSTPSPSSAPSATAEPTLEATSQVERHTVIPGSNPVDLYLSLEQRGFSVEKQFGSEMNSWTCTQDFGSVKYTTEVFGPEVDVTGSVRATVLADGVNKSAQVGADFLSFVASMPYEDAQPQKAHDWVVEHLNEDSANITIGSVRFLLRAPTDMMRMLLIDPA